MKRYGVMVAMVLGLLSAPAAANEWVQDVAVTRIGTYQELAKHYVWFSVVPQECMAEFPSNPVMYFEDNQPGGKALMAVLMTALVNQRKVDVQAKGCQIYEVYLK